MFLTRVPAHAAVKETVQIIKDSKYRRFSSLVNAVLRNIARSGPAPVPALSEDPGKHIRIATSTPRWLVDRLMPELGVEKTLFLFEAINRTPPLTLRTNTTRISREELIRELQRLGIRAHAGTLSPFAVILEDRVTPAELGPFDEGLCTVQDEGAQLIAPLLEAVPGAVILDACAAPGGKTSHLTEIQKDAGFIVAADISSKRLRMMADNLRRLGTARTAFLSADFNAPPFRDDVFDRILLDVPCSGTGVLRRHPEGKWKKDLQTIASMARTQGNLLFSAARILKRGGRLLYTTCSILKEENEDVVDRFLLASANMIRIDMRENFQGSRKDLFTPRGELRLWPHIHDCDGFYACLMEKRE
jgi:16S rRNA (cytosine967-C5)-methyltransferase